MGRLDRRERRTHRSASQPSRASAGRMIPPLVGLGFMRPAGAPGHWRQPRWVRSEDGASHRLPSCAPPARPSSLTSIPPKTPENHKSHLFRRACRDRLRACRQSRLACRRLRRPGRQSRRQRRGCRRAGRCLRRACRWPRRACRRLLAGRWKSDFAKKAGFRWKTPIHAQSRSLRHTADARGHISFLAIQFYAWSGSPSPQASPAGRGSPQAASRRNSSRAGVERSPSSSEGEAG